MLGNTKGKLINQYVPDYVLYDLETTGTSSKYDEVIEISAVKVKNGVVTEEFSQLVNPGRPIPSAASAVNHITDDMVAFAPMFDSVLQQFLAFIGDDVLAGHNINRFDMKFLYRDCERYFGQTLTNDYIDTLKLARLCLPELSHHRLGDLAQYYGISTAGAHRALNDCRMNQQIFEKLAKELDGTTGRNIEIKNCPVCGQPLKKKERKVRRVLGMYGISDMQIYRKYMRGCNRIYQQHICNFIIIRGYFHCFHL